MNVAALRKKTGLNQSDFWARVRVTQSGGSRYEHGRPIPGPVLTLLDIAYGTPKQATKAIASLQGRATK